MSGNKVSMTTASTLSSDAALNATVGSASFTGNVLHGAASAVSGNALLLQSGASSVLQVRQQCVAKEELQAAQCVSLGACVCSVSLRSGGLSGRPDSNALGTYCLWRRRVHHRG